MPKPKAEIDSLTFSSGRASTVTVEHTARTVKYYNVAEHEMDALTLLNTLQIGAAGVGTLFVSLALTDVFAAVFPTPGTPAGPILVKVVAEVIPALASYLLVWAFRNKVRVIWGKIGSQTTDQKPRQ